MPLPMAMPCRLMSGVVSLRVLLLLLLLTAWFFFQMLCAVAGM